MKKEILINKNIYDISGPIKIPQFVINKKRLEHNCTAMIDRVRKAEISFRPHIKTHKCPEITAMQLGNGFTNRVVVSTLQEAWSLQHFFADERITDLLYGFPVIPSHVPELAKLASYVLDLRLLVDHPDQLRALIAYKTMDFHMWSIFIKIDVGTMRCGVPVDSAALHTLIEMAVSEPNLSLHGFYCHAGHSYAASTLEEAADLLIEEVVVANKAAQYAKNLDNSLRLTVSVGSTPEAHALSCLTHSQLTALSIDDLEIHAGNYVFCDLQQLSTNCITEENIACAVLTEVVSVYPGRGDLKHAEVLVNAGVTALGRESGKIPGFGNVITEGYEDWYLGRLSQEHGILVPKSQTAKIPAIGTRLLIEPQHSCIAANCFAYYLVVDDSGVVIDLWERNQGW